MKLFCHITCDNNLDTFVVNVTNLHDNVGHLIQNNDTGSHSNKTLSTLYQGVHNRSVFGKAVRLSLVPVMRELLTLGPPIPLICELSSLAIMNNDASMLHLLLEYTKHGHCNTLSFIHTIEADLMARSELRNSKLRNTYTTIKNTESRCHERDNRYAINNNLQKQKNSSSDFVQGIIPDAIMELAQRKGCAVDVIQVPQLTHDLELNKKILSNISNLLQYHISSGRPLILRGFLNACNQSAGKVNNNNYFQSEICPLPPIFLEEKWGLEAINKRFSNRFVTVANIPYPNNFGVLSTEKRVSDFFRDSIKMNMSSSAVLNKTNSAAMYDYIFDSEFLHSAQFIINTTNNIETTDLKGTGYFFNNSITNTSTSLERHSWLLNNDQCSRLKHPQLPAVPQLLYFDILSDLYDGDGNLWHQWYLGLFDAESNLYIFALSCFKYGLHIVHIY